MQNALIGACLFFVVWNAIEDNPEGIWASVGLFGVILLFTLAPREGKQPLPLMKRFDGLIGFLIVWTCLAALAIPIVTLNQIWDDGQADLSTITQWAIFGTVLLLGSLVGHLVLPPNRVIGVRVAGVFALVGSFLGFLIATF